MPTAKGFDPKADPDSWPSYISAIRDAEDTSWFELARCRRGGAYSPEYWTCNDGPLGRRKREMAEMECQICSVQWDCVQFAIDTGDRWNLCAVRPEERETLASSEGWRDRVKMAEEIPMSIHDLVAGLLQSE